MPLACHYRLFSGSPGAAKPPNEPQDGLPPPHRAGPDSGAGRDLPERSLLDLQPGRPEEAACIGVSHRDGYQGIESC